MRKKTKKRVNKVDKPTRVLTICGDCKIRLVVLREEAKVCGLCGSSNISTDTWR